MRLLQVLFAAGVCHTAVALVIPSPASPAKSSSRAMVSARPGFFQGIGSPFNGQVQTACLQNQQFALAARAEAGEQDVELLDFDEALEKYGRFGRANLVQYVIVSLVWTWEMLVIVGPVFLSALKFEVASHSVVGTFQLGASAAAWVGAVNSLFWGGVIAGVAVAGSFSDKYGRRTAILVSAAINTVFGLFGALADSASFYAFTRVMAGIGIGFGMTNAYVLATELVRPQLRGRAGACLSWFSSLGLLLLAVLAYFIRDWRTLLGVISLLCATPLLFQKYILESPRWLLVQGRTQEAEQVLSKVLHEAPPLRLRAPSSLAQETETPGPGAKTRSENLTHIIRSHVLRVRFAVMVICWYSVGLVFYSYCFSIADLPGSVYVNQAVSGLAEIPLVPLQALLLSQVGRRGAVVGSAIACGVFSLAGFLDAIPFFPLSLAPFLLASILLLARLSASMCFMSLYLFSSELFPTSIRSSAMAGASLASRLGSFAAPLLLAAGAHSHALAGSSGSSMSALVLLVSAGCMLSSAALAATLLPETRDTPLAATIADVDPAMRSTDTGDSQLKHPHIT